MRATFERANNKVAQALARQPSMHEEMLDHILVAELAASPPTFFANSRTAIAIETHWLGGRWMHHRWEIADIAIFVSPRGQGQLLMRKVALLQTKRLYSHELAGTEIEPHDYMIGIGRLADRVDPQVPLSSQRSFCFNDQSKHQQLQSDSHQVGAIDEYSNWRNIPVYYGLYNPIAVPYAAMYPMVSQSTPTEVNVVGCRVIPATSVHTLLHAKAGNWSPTYKDLTFPTRFDAADVNSIHGWRIERFMADEVLNCRQGRLFEDTRDPNLRGLLYERGAPIASAIAITIDFHDAAEE
ncbi:MAG: hypothetical protein NTV97_35160 [Alphaproteobacteria bacterium]|nr:hypothetical protein [Alphaproteobacteria bacterium]